MDRRSHESPMDFEWQTQPPADVTSPFYQLSQRHGQRRGFESPIKQRPSQPDPTAFAFDPTANPATPFRNPSFTTPRKPFDAELFSETSGAESSPADNGDTEDTPETIRTSTEMTTFKSGFPHRKPLFGRYGGNFLGGTPGRGEIRRTKHLDTASQKARKRKRMEMEYTVANGRRGSSDVESDTPDARPHGRRERSDSPLPQSWLASALSFIESKPALPYILSYYVQLAMNYFLVGLLMYIIWCFILTIRADVDKESEAQIESIRAGMSLCASRYVENKCAKATRLPALESICTEWESCMNQNPARVGRARVSAHTFAEIFNSFVEPISWKAMVFVILIIVVCFGVNNFAFGVFRAKASHPPPAPQYYAPPPPTPSHAQEYRWIPQTPQHPSHPLDQGFYGAGMDSQFQALISSQVPEQRSPRKANWN